MSAVRAVASAPGGRGASSEAKGAASGAAGSTTGTSPVAGAGLLFLREDEIRLAQDLMFFAYRDFTAVADVILAELGLGRAHHRALHFIGRNPTITVSDLLSLLRITKQSLARVLSVLIEQGYVAQAPGSTDRRQRLLTLTPAGEALERRLFERQKQRLTAAYREAGAAAVDGFRRVMRAVMDDDARAYLDRPDADHPVARGRGARPRPA
ncbi:MAG: MarR family transcriptional regulator [Pseudomonadota bacterium]|nr:MarR family transcriptional regulator [Pseudomonadota bacterium]